MASSFTQEVEAIIRDSFNRMPFAGLAIAELVRSDKRGELQQETVAEALRRFRDEMEGIAGQYQAMREQLLTNDAERNALGRFIVDVLGRGGVARSAP